MFDIELSMSIPSKHLLVFKASWGRLQDMSWRRLQHVFSVTIFRLPRRLAKTSWRVLENVLKTSCKTSWRRLGRRKIVTLKASWRRLEDMPWRRLEDISWRRLEDMSCRRLQDVLEKNKSKCVYLWSSKSTFNKCISDKSKANPKCIDQNPIIPILSLFWNTSSISIFRTKISEIGVWPSETIKTKF